MPPDVDTKKGVYEMGVTEQAMFSGLYRVITMEHNFVDGKYINVLECTRFNNQGVYISNPVENYTATHYSNKETQIFSKKEQLAAYLESEGGDISKVTNIIGKTTDFYNNVVKKIKGIGA